MRIAPSIEDYEKRLLEKVALTHFEAFPASMISDETDSLILPVIEERRIRIGFHNGYSFIGPSVLTNAVPELDDRGHGSDLVFHGQLELPKYLPREAGVVLGFVVEYKVRITVRAPAEKKNALSALVDTITKAPKPAIEKAYVDKLVSLGWSAWSVCDEFARTFFCDRF